MLLQDYLNKYSATVQDIVGDQFTEEAYSYIASLPVVEADGVVLFTPVEISDVVAKYSIVLPQSFCAAPNCLEGLFEDLKDFRD